MANIGSLLKSEILRLANKAAKAQVEPLRNTVRTQRKQISELNRLLGALRKEQAALGRTARRRASGPALAPDGADGAAHRFQVRGLKSLRARLGLSAADFGRLVGVSGQSIYLWETEKTTPRPAQVAALAQIRGIGKKEAVARLEKLAAEETGKTAE